METSPKVTLSLSHDQALVLFEWLTREDSKGLPSEHPAEQSVLWEIEAQLERSLIEPLQADYASSVAAARVRLTARDPREGEDPDRG
jgi:hypothetical protein